VSLSEWTEFSEFRSNAGATPLLYRESDTLLLLSFEDRRLASPDSADQIHSECFIRVVDVMFGVVFANQI